MSDLPPPPPDLLDGAALLLDFDGTLVELETRPDAVRVDDRLASLMQRLAARLDGRIAVITGRPAEEVARLFAGPSFVIAGSHGLELRGIDGRIVAGPRPPGLDISVAAFRAFAESDARLIVEEKPLGVALHYRAAPEHATGAAALASDLAATHALHLQPGKMMIELRRPGADKGSALAAIMAEPAMASARPVFLGDDATDEPAMIAADRLGGVGILIGDARPTAATYRLPDVAATRAWLERAAG